MLVDLAHAPWSVVASALERSSAPVMISHTHLASGADPHPRLVTDEHALAVAEAGGVIGAWPSGVVLETFDDYLDEIVRMVELLGAAHVGIGTDMDGNYRPVMTRFEQFDDLETGLGERGLSDDAIDLVLGGSFVRLFERVVESATLD
jgi:membrane dipeptidase